MKQPSKEQLAQRAEYKRQWHLRNKERMNQGCRERHLANREAILAERRAEYAQNPIDWKEYYRRNKERIREREQQYRKENPHILKAMRERNREALRERVQRWNASNREHVRAYRQVNADRYREHGRKRYARVRALEGSYTRAEWDALVKDHNGVCAYCLTRQATCAEHRTPVTRGGTNWIANILPACRSCNSRKNNKTEAEFRKLWSPEKLQELIA